MDNAIASADVEWASDLEDLARQTDTSIGLVDQLYRAECADLERDARISTFIPALAHRRVKAALRSHHVPDRLSQLRRRGARPSHYP
jgi:Protein of unknown function (DUF3562)